MKSAAKRRPPNAGAGRKKGVRNKVTRELKEMILGALDDAGGQGYLAKQAVLNPAAFLSLVGKVLPMTIKADEGGGLVVQVVRYGNATAPKQLASAALPNGGDGGPRKGD